VIVTLVPHELDLAAFVGVRRRQESLKRAWPNLRTPDDTGFDRVDDLYENDIQAAAAEMALAKGLNLYWDGGVDTFKRGDVGKLQCRQASREDDSLIIRQRDQDDDIQVLVIGRIPTFDLRGAMRTKYGKRDEFLRAPNGRPAAWFVPQSALGPVELIPR
jgi:hypothetical protein